MISATPRTGGRKINVMNMEASLRELRTDMVSLHEILAWAALGRELLAALSLKHEIRLRQGHDAFVAQSVPGLSETREHLLDAIAALNHNEASKRCHRCRETRTLKSFAKSQSSPDGHWRYCLECERKRVSAYEKKKRGG